MKLKQTEIDHLSRNYRASYTPDVEAGLARLHRRLQEQEQRTEAAPATPPRAGRVRLRLVYTLTAAAAALLLFAAALWLLTDSTVSLHNDGAQIATYTLPDGTRVVLQQGSEISYNRETYNINDRHLTLDGQAYFEVEHDEQRPFYIGQGDNELRVTGTAFNLRTQGELMEVEVSEGSVLVRRGQDSRPVGARQCALAAPDRPLSVEPAPHLNHQAWRTNSLHFDNVSFTQVLSYFDDNWGIRCDWSEGQNCDYPVSGSFDAADADAVLRDLAKLGGLSLRSHPDDPKRYILSGDCR